MGYNVIVARPITERQVGEVGEWYREDPVVGIGICDCKTLQVVQTCNRTRRVVAEHTTSGGSKTEKGGGNDEAFKGWHAAKHDGQMFCGQTIGIGRERSLESETPQGGPIGFRHLPEWRRRRGQYERSCRGVHAKD